MIRSLSVLVVGLNYNKVLGRILKTVLTGAIILGVGQSCSEDEQINPPELIVTKDVIELDRETPSASFVIDKDGEGTLEWNLISSSNSLTLNRSSGVDDEVITVQYLPGGFQFGIFEESILVNSNGGTKEIQVIVRSKNLTGTWSGIYSWECSESLTGAMDIQYIIEDKLNGSFTGTVLLNSGSTPINTSFVGYNKTGMSEDSVFIQLSYSEVTSKFVENDLNGYVDIKTKTIVGVTSNGDSPVYNDQGGCSAETGPSGTVEASLID